MSTITDSLPGIRISSVLLKACMAITGMLLAGWLTLHMLGNLLVFAGPVLMNAYGERLQATGLLWPMRMLLLAACALHVVCAAITTRRSRAARPIGYRAPLRSAASTAASRSMRVSGALLLAYIVYHVGIVHGLAHPSFVASDVHHNLVSLLHRPVHAAGFAFASALLAAHLAHGLGSAWISLGWVPRSRERWVHRGMRTWAACVTLGFAAIAVAPWFGWI